MEIIWLTALIGVPGLIGLWAGLYRAHINAKLKLKETQRALVKTEELLVVARAGNLSPEKVKEERELL